MRRPLALVIPLALLAGCAADPDPACEPAPRDARADEEPVCFVVDGWTLHGSSARGLIEAGPAFVLVHGLGEDRANYAALSDSLATLGRGVLRFDLRGHGASTTRDGVPVAADAFTGPADFAGMDADVAAAVADARARHGDGAVALVGASLGANLALRYAAADANGTRAVVLLSPGLDYRGVPSETANAAYDGRVLYVAAEGDAYARESAEALHRKGAGEVRDLEIRPGDAHGTRLLDLEGRALVVDWLRRVGLV